MTKTVATQIGHIGKPQAGRKHRNASLCAAKQELLTTEFLNAVQGHSRSSI